MHRILIVDDKEPIAAALSDYFAGQGYQVDCVKEKHEAEERLRTGEYALVITDLRLTGMDSTEGLDIVKYARQQSPATRTILLTAYGSTQIEQEARQRGANLVLMKPQPLAALNHKVTELLHDALEGTVLVVDDEPANQELLRELLHRCGLRVLTASNGSDGLQLFTEHRPDVVLLDVQMPRMDGFEVCRRIKGEPETRLTPVIIMTGLSASEDRVRGIASGADDFIVKPFDRTELLARVRSLLKQKAFTDELDRSEGVLEALAMSIERKDPYTAGHCERLADLGERLGRRLGLNGDQIIALRRAGFLHDIGKVAVPDSILSKPGPLTPAEMEIMKSHTVVGEKICAPLQSLKLVLPIIRHHHEKLDGSGYPDGLRAGAIPMTARVLQTVDVYDALTTDRPYRAALSNEDAMQVMWNEVRRGWWDAEIVNQLEQMVAAGDTASQQTA